MEEVRKVRVYHFLSAKYGIQNLEFRRLKVANLMELNDPFEFSCFDFTDEKFRKNMGDFKKLMSERVGFICCSRSFSNPVQWAHYAEKHKGICLGFDVDENRFLEVEYVSERLKFEEILDGKKTEEELFLAMCGTKFEHWRYEDEIRFTVDFTGVEALDGFQFYTFGTDLELKQVILGCESVLTKSGIEKALVGYGEGVEIFKVRPSYKVFSMEVDEGELS